MWFTMRFTSHCVENSKEVPFGKTIRKHCVCLFYSAFLSAVHWITIVDAASLESLNACLKAYRISEFGTSISQYIFKNGYKFIEKASTKAQIVKCRYLYAHCLRHLGEDLEQAYTVFDDLINDADNNDDKIRIRSIYSAASIRMFQCNINYPYKKAFDDIEQIICNNTANEIWKPYVARHKAIYEYKIRKNFRLAEKILLETIDLLEVTPLRIKYDIYFQLGEIYRLMDTELDNYEKS